MADSLQLSVEPVRGGEGEDGKKGGRGFCRSSLLSSRLLLLPPIPTCRGGVSRAAGTQAPGWFGDGTWVPVGLWVRTLGSQDVGLGPVHFPNSPWWWTRRPCPLYIRRGRHREARGLVLERAHPLSLLSFLGPLRAPLSLSSSPPGRGWLSLQGDRHPVPRAGVGGLAGGTLGSPLGHWC